MKIMLSNKTNSKSAASEIRIGLSIVVNMMVCWAGVGHNIRPTREGGCRSDM